MGQRLRILLILIEPPLPFGNAGSRWFHVLVRELQRRGHHLDILVASGVDSDIEKARTVFADWTNLHVFPFAKPQGLFSKIKTLLYPQRFSFNSDFQDKLKNLNPDSYDILHVEQTWGAWMSLPWARKTLVNVHFLQAIDLEIMTPRNIKEFLMFRSWFWAEKKLLQAHPHVRTCSPRLKQHIAGWGGHQTLESVPFGLDLSLYTFIRDEDRLQSNPVVTLIGNMTWSPSLSAARRLMRDLWPHIKQRVPSARLRIVGWGARTQLAEFLNAPGIEIVENVPDIKPYFQQASVLVYAPSRGSGMKIKVMESLAFGVPVVTTSEGVEGLDAVDMKHLGICDEDQGLIDRTVHILSDTELQNSLRREGRQLLETQCSPEVTVDGIERLYAKIRTSNS